MLYSFRKFLTLVLFATTAVLTSCHTYAAMDYPNQPIRFIHTYGPGGSMDQLVRVMASELEQELDTPVVVESKPGGSGVIGVSYLLNAKPDGYTVLFGDSRILYTNWQVLEDLSYTASDFEYGIAIAKAPLVIAANTGGRITNSEDLATGLRTYSVDLDVVTAGINSPHHVLLADLEQSLNTVVTHVPLRGDSQSILELISGRVDLGIFGPIILMNYSKEAKVKSLAVAWYERLAQFPDVPTLDELGIKDVRITAQVGYLYPRGTPSDVIEVLSSASKRVLARTSVSEQIQMVGFVPDIQEPSTLRELVYAAESLRPTFKE